MWFFWARQFIWQLILYQSRVNRLSVVIKKNQIYDFKKPAQQ